MKTTTEAAARLMRASNPVPPDAFGGAADERLGQAAFEAITASPPRRPARRATQAASRPGRAPSGALTREPPAGASPCQPSWRRQHWLRCWPSTAPAARRGPGPPLPG